MDTDDGPLPFGVGVAINSTNILGTPNSVGPSGKPFRLTFRVVDRVVAEQRMRQSLELQVNGLRGPPPAPTGK